MFLYYFYAKKIIKHLRLIFITLPKPTIEFRALCHVTAEKSCSIASKFFVKLISLHWSNGIVGIDHQDFLKYHKFVEVWPSFRRFTDKITYPNENYLKTFLTATPFRSSSLLKLIPKPLDAPMTIAFLSFICILYDSVEVFFKIKKIETLLDDETPHRTRNRPPHICLIPTLDSSDIVHLFTPLNSLTPAAFYQLAPWRMLHLRYTISRFLHVVICDALNFFLLWTKFLN